MPFINPNEIIIPENRLRPIDPDAVKKLAKEIGQTQQDSPIKVRQADNTLIFGAHRLMACRTLGIDVWYEFADVSEDEAERMELSENYFVNNLTQAQRIQHVNRLRKLKAKARIRQKTAQALEDGQISQSTSDSINEQLDAGTDVSEVHTDTHGREDRAVKSLKSKAQSEATKELAQELGTTTQEVSRDSSTAQALEQSGLPQEELDQYSGAELKKIAKAAKGGEPKPKAKPKQVEPETPKPELVIKDDVQATLNMMVLAGGTEEEIHKLLGAWLMPKLELAHFLDADDVVEHLARIAEGEVISPEPEVEEVAETSEDEAQGTTEDILADEPQEEPEFTDEYLAQEATKEELETRPASELQDILKALGGRPRTEKVHLLSKAIIKQRAKNAA